MVDFQHMWTYTTNPLLAFGDNINPLVADLQGNGQYKIVCFGDGSIYGNPDWLFVLNADGTLYWKAQLSGSRAPHTCVTCDDVNNDGKLEIIVPGGNIMTVFKYDGTILWNKTGIQSNENHPVLLDVDETGFPYVFASGSCCAGVDAQGEHKPICSWIRKINASNGNEIKHIDSWYPCHGGFTGGVIDGEYMIFMCDRQKDAVIDGCLNWGAKGIQAYWANDMTLAWSKPNIGCSSHLPVLYDMNDDGELEIIISQQRDTLDSGIYCINAKTGNYITGHCLDNAGLDVHESFPIHHLNKPDGQPRLTTCCWTKAKVYNLHTMSVEATIGYDGKPPTYGSVSDDGGMDIILAEYPGVSRGLNVYNNMFQKVATIPSVNPGGSTVQDIDGDGFNELIFWEVGSDNYPGGYGKIHCYKTPGVTKYPLPRSHVQQYSELRWRTAVYVPKPKIGNQPPQGIVDDTESVFIQVQ